MTLRRALLAALASVSLGAFAPPALAVDAAPALIETPHRDPWVPPQARIAPATAPLSGKALHADVEEKLAASFDAADVTHAGALTRAQAADAGLGYISRHFDDIDVAGRGSVTFADVMRYLDRRAEEARSRPR